MEFRHDASRRPAARSHDMFTFDGERARVVCGYGPAAVVYLVAGNLVADRVRRH